MFQVLEDIERRIRDAGKDAKLIEATVIDERPPAPITVESLPVASTMAETLAARPTAGNGPVRAWLRVARFPSGAHQPTSFYAVRLGHRPSAAAGAAVSSATRIRSRPRRG